MCRLEHRQELWQVMKDLSASVIAGKGSGQDWWALLGTSLSLLLYLLFLSLPFFLFSLSFLFDFVCVHIHATVCIRESEATLCKLGVGSLHCTDSPY
ncbi:hypothetical protein ACRRTK_000956 [Alexandromys fortis]